MDRWQGGVLGLGLCDIDGHQCGGGLSAALRRKRLAPLATVVYEEEDNDAGSNGTKATGHSDQNQENHTGLLVHTSCNKTMV